jgi:hypothetical protein
MFRKGIAFGLAAVALTGCASQRPNWSRLGNTSKPDQPGESFYRDPHHQYFDKGRKRYYYYDPAQKAFFWENGQPKN